MVSATKCMPRLATRPPLAPGVMLWTFGAQERPRAPRDALTMCTPTWCVCVVEKHIFGLHYSGSLVHAGHQHACPAPLPWSTRAKGAHIWCVRRTKRGGRPSHACCGAPVTGLDVHSTSACRGHGYGHGMHATPRHEVTTSFGGHVVDIWSPRTPAGTS